jgi:SAM-dependent methyltransferase
MMHKLRKESGQRQTVLARKINVHPDKLRRFERGEQIPQAQEMSKFCEILGLADGAAKTLMQLYLASQMGPREINVKAEQGWNPTTVFADLYPILYAAETPISGAFIRQSERTATYADAIANLHGKRVLDLGCGYGLTTLALTAFSPKEIVMVDNSPGMIELMHQVLRSRVSIDLWLRSKGADEVLGEFYDRTLAHLKLMRTSFQEGLFTTSGGILTPINQDSLSLTTDNIGAVDVIVGNNVLHWPVNQLRGQQQTDDIKSALHGALRPLASLLPLGGFAVFMEPSDFVMDDANTNRDTYIVEHSFISHPVFRAFHQVLNDRIEERYDEIKRAMPKRHPLFSTKQLPQLLEGSQFKLVPDGVRHVEWTFTCDPVAACFVRMPLLLGQVNLPFQEKIDLGRNVQRTLARTLTDVEVQTPLREQWFFIILQRVA